jgi:hypothetical protein
LKLSTTSADAGIHPPAENIQTQMIAQLQMESEIATTVLFCDANK